MSKRSVQTNKKADLTKIPEEAGGQDDSIDGGLASSSVGHQVDSNSPPIISVSSAPSSTSKKKPSKKRQKYKLSAKQAILDSVQKGLVYAINQAEKQRRRDILEKDFKTVEYCDMPRDGSRLTLAHSNVDIKFISYASVAFRHLREIYGIKSQDYFLSLACGELQEVGNSGASGSLFYITADNRYILKTVQEKEARCIQKLLAQYFMSSLGPNQDVTTFLPKFYGLYGYKTALQTFRFVVMNNLLPNDVDFHEKYDLKGSTHKRSASKKELAKRHPTLKDLDFIQRHPHGIIIEDDLFDVLQSQFEADALILESFSIIDYSLLLAVHNLDQAERRRRDAEHERVVAEQLEKDHQLVSSAAQRDQSREIDGDEGEVCGEGGDGVDASNGTINAEQNYCGSSDRMEHSEFEDFEEERSERGAEELDDEEDLNELASSVAEIERATHKRNLSLNDDMLAADKSVSSDWMRSTTAAAAARIEMGGAAGAANQQPGTRGGGGRLTAENFMNKEQKDKKERQRLFLNKPYYEGRLQNNDRVHFYMGIIDILQPYHITKKMEYGMKSIFYNENTVSVTKPHFYQNRFLAFIFEKVFQKRSQFEANTETDSSASLRPWPPEADRLSYLKKKNSQWSLYSSNSATRSVTSSFTSSSRPISNSHYLTTNQYTTRSAPFYTSSAFSNTSTPPRSAAAASSAADSAATANNYDGGGGGLGDVTLSGVSTLPSPRTPNAHQSSSLATFSVSQHSQSRHTTLSDYSTSRMSEEGNATLNSEAAETVGEGEAEHYISKSGAPLHHHYHHHQQHHQHTTQPQQHHHHSRNSKRREGEAEADADQSDSNYSSWHKNNSTAALSFNESHSSNLSGQLEQPQQHQSSNAHQSQQTANENAANAIANKINQAIEGEQWSVARCSPPSQSPSPSLRRHLNAADSPKKHKRQEKQSKEIASSKQQQQNTSKKHHQNTNRACNDDDNIMIVRHQSSD